MNTPDAQATARKVSRKTRWLVVGAFIGGAFLTSAADLVTKPILSWLGNLLFDLVTLGLNSLRDGMYAQVAEMQSERASVLLFVLAVGAMIGLFSAIFLHKTSGSSTSWTGAWRRRMSAENARVWMVRLRAIYVAVFAGFMLVTSFRVAYVTLVANRVDQLQRTVAPHLSEHQRLLNTSRIASMRTREEFMSIWLEMASVATANGKPVPEVTFY